MQSKSPIFFLLFYVYAIAGAQVHLPVRTEGSSGAGFHFSKKEKDNSLPEILVQLQKGTSPEAVLADLRGQYGLPVLFSKNIAPRLNFYNFKITPPLPADFSMDLLRSHPAILAAQWDTPVVFRDSIPDDPRWDAQWNMERIGLPAVWEVNTGGHTSNGDEIVVAILDSGFDLTTHEDLSDYIWENIKEVQGTPGFDDDGNGLVDDFNGWNFINNTNMHPVKSHGTSVAGIIGAGGNNGTGVAGVNWKVKMMLFTIYLNSEVVAAFDYILQQRQLYNATNGAQGAFVVATNGSFGIDGVFCSEAPVWGAMYDLLGEAGILNVAATANQNWNVDEVGDMPTTCTSDFLISVTATNEEDERVANAAFGPTSIDLAAPSGVVSTASDNNYDEMFEGTSAACPHVAGTIALLYSLPCNEIADLALTDPPAAALLMRETLLENTIPIASLNSKTVTGGRLDASEAMKYLHVWCTGTPADRASQRAKETFLGKKGFVRLFPNPASSTVTVHFSAIDFDHSLTFRFFNAFGQEVKTNEILRAVPFEKQQFTFDVSQWPPGLYIINIIDNSRKISRPFLVF